MDDCIKRHAALEEIMARGSRYMCMHKRFGGTSNLFADAHFEIADLIRCLPAADVEPVRHGRWEFLGPNWLTGDGCLCGTCSVCKKRCKYIVNSRLCPNCGAKMDLEDGTNDN